MMRKRTLTILILAVMVMTATTAFGSLLNPFGGMKQIKLLDGTATVAVCRDQSPESRLYFWESGQEVPRGCLLNVSWDFMGPDAKHPDREAWIGVSDPGQKYNLKHGLYEGGRVIKQDHAYRMTVWIPIPNNYSESTMALTFGVRGKDGEKDKTEKLIIPISVYNIDAFASANEVVAEPYGVAAQSEPMPIPIIQPEPIPAPDSDDGMDGCAVSQESKSMTYNGRVALELDKPMFLISGRKYSVQSITMHKKLSVGGQLIFFRNGKAVAKAVITDLERGQITAKVISGDKILVDDGINYESGGRK